MLIADNQSVNNTNHHQGALRPNGFNWLSGNLPDNLAIQLYVFIFFIFTRARHLTLMMIDLTLVSFFCSVANKITSSSTYSDKYHTYNRNELNRESNADFAWLKINDAESLRKLKIAASIFQ